MAILNWGWRKILLRTLAVIFIIYVSLVVYRIFYFVDLEKTNKQVEKIHATKITLDDVFGRNLPPDLGAEADKTVAGIDVNKNGIRDDVELAIFKEYPNSAKTRAVLLQYALALQMEVIQPIVNTETVTEVVREQSRADVCISDTLVPRKSPESSRSYEEVERIDRYVNFVKDKQINTTERDNAEKNFYKELGSYSESENEVCDINITTLSN